MLKQAHGRTRKREVSAVRAALRGGLLIFLGCSLARAADNRPDVLGLRRLEAVLQAESAADADDLPSIEERFILPVPEDGWGEPPAEMSDTRRQLLAWLNDYAKNQVLFHRRDIVNLRKSLSTISEEQLARWDADSKPLRDRLVDDSWPVTQQWLRDFLVVQAIYPADQIDSLRSSFSTLRPSQLIRVLDHFQSIHLARLRNREATERLRMQQSSLSRPDATATNEPPRRVVFRRRWIPRTVGTSFTSTICRRSPPHAFAASFKLLHQPCDLGTRFLVLVVVAPSSARFRATTRQRSDLATREPSFLPHAAPPWHGQRLRPPESW